MSPLVTVLSILAAGALGAPTQGPTEYSAADIDQCIRSGRIGAEYADRAKMMEDLQVQEILMENLPYQLFSFTDFRAGYTLLVEPDGKLVVLCAAFRGGRASNFQLLKSETQVTLRYRYTSGSGRTFEHQAEYIVGSGQPREASRPRDVTGG